MTVFISSSVNIVLVNGIGVTINTPAVANYTTDDVFNPLNPNQTLTQMLNAINSSKLVSSTSVDCTIVANTVPLYVIPTTKKLYITGIYFGLTNISGSGSVPAISVGFTPSTYRDIIDGQTNSTMFVSPVTISTVGQILPVTNFPTVAGASGVDYAFISGGNQLTAYVTSASTYSTYKVQCNVFGFLTS